MHVHCSMNFFVVVLYFLLSSVFILLSEGRPETGASNNVNKPQPNPNKRPILWTSGKILTLLIVLVVLIGGVLFCCCFQFSCSVTIRNFNEDQATLLKPNSNSKLVRKYQSENQLERWE